MAKKKPYLHAARYKYHNIVKSRRRDSSVSVFCTFPFCPPEAVEPRAETLPPNVAPYVVASRCFIGRKGKGHREEGCRMLSRDGGGGGRVCVGEKEAKRDEGREGEEEEE